MRLKRVARLMVEVIPRLVNKDIFFVFPGYHMGGAETVHVDIMKVFSRRKCVCIISKESANEINKKAFFDTAHTIDISSIIRRQKEKDIALEFIAKMINRAKAPIVFGCNSHFFYHLVPYLKPKVKVIDLVHAFSYEEPDGAEIYSLPCIERIDKRVVLGEKTLSDFRKLYAENGKDPALLSRITTIRNQVVIPEDKPVSKTGGPLKILYVGRENYEKRPEIFFEVAQRCHDLGISADFEVIGFSTDRKISPNVTIIGELDRATLNRHYIASHMLLITSSREGFPMVVLEGMTYGVVPICTAVGEIPSFITPGNANGFLVSSDQPVSSIVDDFVEKIRMLNNDRSLLDQISKNAFETVSHTFDPETFRRSYMNLFDT